MKAHIELTIDDAIHTAPEREAQEIVDVVNSLFYGVRARRLAVAPSPHKSGRQKRARPRRRA